MITVEDVKVKMQSEPAKTNVQTTQIEKKKKPFYKKPIFWGLVIGGGALAFFLAKRGKNATNSIEY